MTFQNLTVTVQRLYQVFWFSSFHAHKKGNKNKIFTFQFDLLTVVKSHSVSMPLQISTMISGQ